MNHKLLILLDDWANIDTTFYDRTAT